MASTEPLISDDQNNSTSTVHINALDALANVNSLFSGVVFLGLNLNSNATLLETGDPCAAPASLARLLVLLEVLSFAFYLLSSLIAQGLKLQVNLVGAKKNVPKSLVPINEKTMRFGMLATAVSTLVGTIFLTLSIVAVIEIRLGLLTCSTSHWSQAAIIPLVISVFAGVSTFVATVIYAFLT